MTNQVENYKIKYFKIQDNIWRIVKRK